MSVTTKVNEVALENGFQVYRVKYLDSFGFAKVFYKMKRLGNNVYVPAFIFPIEEDKDDAEDMLKFKNFLIKYDLGRYFDTNNLTEQDMNSILAIIKYADSEAFAMSGKKKPHEDKSENFFLLMVKEVIDKHLEPLYLKLCNSNQVASIVCFYNESEDVFLATSSDSDDFQYINDMYDKAYKFDIANAVSKHIL